MYSRRVHSNPSTVVSLVIEQVITLVLVAAMATDVAPPERAAAADMGCQTLGEQHKITVLFPRPPPSRLDARSYIVGT